MADKNNDTEKVAVRATARYIRISPYKARKVMDLVRGKDVEEAKRILTFSPTHASRVIEKVLDSAVANAENNNGLRVDDLVVDGGVDLDTVVGVAAAGGNGLVAGNSLYRAPDMAAAIAALRRAAEPVLGRGLSSVGRRGTATP